MNWDYCFSIYKYRKMIKKTMKNLSELEWYDVSVIKLCMLAFTLMLAVLLPNLTKASWEIYFVVFVITYVYLMFVIFQNKQKKQNFFNRTIYSVRWFSILDWAIFELCLFSFTLMLAVLLPVLLESAWRIYWIVFLVSYVYILCKFVFKPVSTE